MLEVVEIRSIARIERGSHRDRAGGLLDGDAPRQGHRLHRRHKHRAVRSCCISARPFRTHRTRLHERTQLYTDINDIVQSSGRAPTASSRPVSASRVAGSSTLTRVLAAAGSAASGTPAPSVSWERFSPGLGRVHRAGPGALAAAGRLGGAAVDGHLGQVQADQPLVGGQDRGAQRLEHPGGDPLIPASAQRAGRARGVGQPLKPQPNTSSSSMRRR